LAELRRLEGLDAAEPPAADLADLSTSTLAARLLSGTIAPAPGPTTPAEPGPDAPPRPSATVPPAGAAGPAASPPGPGWGASSGSSTRSREYIRTVAQLGVQVAEA